MPQIKLGIPKGSLERSTIELFGQAGWAIQTNTRNYFPAIDDPEMSCALVRSQEMGTYVANGTLDLGLTGLDWIMETQADVTPVCDLVYSKLTTQGCRWVLVVRKDSEIQAIEDLQGKVIATELVGFTQRYLRERGVDAKVEFSWGATEAKVVEGLADAAVEITETGSTIRAHGLRIVADLLYTHTQLIANPAAYQDPWKRAKIDQIALLLQAALKARGKVVIKLNVPKDKVDAIIRALPSLHAPTINHMFHSDWLAVETVVDKSEVRDLIPKLVALGAQGIVEQDLLKVV
jgi:ATP phosphoribosyltransferase